MQYDTSPILTNSSSRLASRIVSKTALAILIGSMLSGCLSSSTDDKEKADTSDTPTDKRVAITGVAVKGILANAIVEAYDITGTTKLAEAVTDDKGRYTLPKFEHDGPILVKLRTQASTKATCDGAKGCKDSSGATVAFGTKYDFNDAEFDLSAVLPSATAASEQELMVTPITHMAAARVQAAATKNGGKISSADVEGLNRATATMLGLGGIDINKIAPVDITDGNATKAGSASAQLYGALVASIQTLAEENPNSTVANVIDALAADYATNNGVVSKSSTEGTISLEKIFSGAIEVVAAAETKATAEGIELDLDAAETQLDRDQAEADNAEADVIAEVEPEVVIPEAELTQAQAAQLGIDLLLDLNAWEDALTADQNQTLSNPFFDQLEGTDAILSSIDDQSSLMRGFAKLIGEEHEVTECYWHTAEGCSGYDTYTEFEGGPVLHVVGVIGSLAQLASEIQNQDAIASGTFDYNAQLGSASSIEISSLTDILSEHDDASGTSTLVYDLNATFTIAEGKISTITFVMNSAEAAYPDNFSITLTQSDLDDTSNKIAFGVSASSINLVSEGIVLSIPQGTTEAPTGMASLTFDTAADRKVFSATTVGDPSWAKLNAINVHFVSQGVLSGAVTEAGADIPNTTANLLVDFNYNYNAAAVDVPNTTTRLALGINASNNSNEEIDGKFTLTANGNFSETEAVSTFFEQALNFKRADAKFVGKVVNSATDAAGTLQMAEFNGSIIAGMDFFSPTVVVTDAEQLINKAVAKLEGSIFVSTTPSGGEKSKVGFVGSAEVTLALVKTPQGAPFKLYDKEQYHVNKAKLFGRISANQDIDATTNIADRSASLAINAVVNADITGLKYNNNANLPNNGDVVAQLSYGLKSIDDNTAVAFVDRMQAIDDAKAALVLKGVDAKLDHNDMMDIIANFSRTNCVDRASAAYQLCDITAVENRLRHEWFDSTVTNAEALAQAEMHVNDYNPFGRKLVPAPETALVLTGGDAVVDSCQSYNQLTDQCTVSRNYTTTAEFPADVTDQQDRQMYLRGTDVQLNEDYHRSFAVSGCDVDTNDNTRNVCTVTRVEPGENYFDPSLSTAEVKTQLDAAYSGYVHSNIACNNGYCIFDRTSTSTDHFSIGLSNESMAILQHGINQYISHSYVVDDTCTTSPCDVTLNKSEYLLFPIGLTPTERDTYFAEVENGFINRTSTLTLNACEHYDDGEMSCTFNQTLTHIHNSVMNHNIHGLTKYIALINQNNTHDLYFNASMKSQYGYFDLSTDYYTGNTVFTGDIGPGESEEQSLPVMLRYFEPKFDPDNLAEGEGAYVQVSANITIKADLTGLDDAKISVFVNRLGEDDAEARIKLTNGNRMLELSFNSTEMMSNGTVNNLKIRNANAEMTLVLTCATDKGDDGVHDNDKITACADGIDMQGDIFVGGFKVANLEDRDGLPVFNFTDGSGYDLIVTPNFVVQPSM